MPDFEVCLMIIDAPLVYVRSALGKHVHLTHLEGLCYTHSDTMSLPLLSVIPIQFFSWCLHILLLVCVQSWKSVKSPHNISLWFCISNVVTTVLGGTHLPCFTLVSMTS